MVTLKIYEKLQHRENLCDWNDTWNSDHSHDNLLANRLG